MSSVLQSPCMAGDWFPCPYCQAEVQESQLEAHLERCTPDAPSDNVCVDDTTNDEALAKLLAAQFEEEEQAATAGSNPLPFVFNYDRPNDVDSALDADERLAKRLQDNFANIDKYGHGTQGYAKRAPLLFGERSAEVLVSAADGEADDGSDELPGEHEALVELLNEHYHDDLLCLVSLYDKFDPKVDEVLIEAIDRWGYDVAVGMSSRRHDFQDRVLSLAEFETAFLDSLQDAAEEREYDVTESSEAGVSRDARVKVQLKKTPQPNATRAPTQYDNVPRTKKPSRREKSGVCAHDRIKAAKAARESVVTYTVMRNSNRTVQAMLAFDRPPTSLEEFFKRANTKFNVRGKSKFTRAFFMDGEELLEASQLYNQDTYLISQGENFVG